MGKTDVTGKVLFSICSGYNWRCEEGKRLLCECHALSLTGRYEEALDLYEEIIQQVPNHLEAHKGRWINKGKWINFVAYGLGYEAYAEANGLEIITGIGFFRSFVQRQ